MTVMTRKEREDLTVERFERKIAEYIGTRHAVLCSTGRTAIMLSLLALGINHGDEVIIPDFADQSIPITVFCNGATPRFSDIDKQTLALSPIHLSKAIGPNTKALIFVHMFGLPVDPSPVLEIARKKGIAFIDDAAQALGASVKGKKAGSFGNAGILTLDKSFDVDHGGAVTTNDELLAAKIRLVRDSYEGKSTFASLSYRVMEFSRSKSRRIMRTIYLCDKYLRKLPNVTLARKHFKNFGQWVEGKPHVLRSWQSNGLTTRMKDQLMTYGGSYTHRRKVERMEVLYVENEFGRIEKYLQARRRIAKVYDDLLEENGFSRIKVPPGNLPSYFRYPILFSEKNRLSRSLRELTQAGFHIDGQYRPLHTSPFFSWLNHDLNFSETIHVSRHILPLPVGLNMTMENAAKVASIVNIDRSNQR